MVDEGGLHAVDGQGRAGITGSLTVSELALDLIEYINISIMYLS
jgi:hypothetical protein